MKEGGEFFLSLLIFILKPVKKTSYFNKYDYNEKSVYFQVFG